jgi:hypothetical protein
MSMTLLHEFDPFRTVLRHLPAARAIERLEDLATLLWDLNAEGGPPR